MRPKLAIVAHSGVGKSTLLRALRRHPELAEKRIIELDSVLPEWFDGVIADSFDKPTSGDYWLWAKMSALRAAIDRERADIVAGLLGERKIRETLEEAGFSIVVLSVPADTHRGRLQKRLREKGYIPLDVERCIRGQRRLEGLGYDLIDADRPVEETAAEVAERMLEAEASRTRQSAQ